MNALLPLLRISCRGLSKPIARLTNGTPKRQPQLRHFTCTPLHRGLHIKNPRLDSATGEAMSIVLTPRAISRLSAIQASDNNPSLALRLTVESGGCHGFQYTIGLSDKVDPAEDTVFTDEASGARVIMDEPSLELLKGSTVDFTQELIGSQFKVVNPMATSSCGCGTSFDIKI